MPETNTNLLFALHIIHGTFKTGQKLHQLIKKWPTNCPLVTDFNTAKFSATFCILLVHLVHFYFVIVGLLGFNFQLNLISCTTNFNWMPFVLQFIFCKPGKNSENWPKQTISDLFFSNTFFAFPEIVRLFLGWKLINLDPMTTGVVQERLGGWMIVGELTSARS